LPRDLEDVIDYFLPGAGIPESEKVKHTSPPGSPRSTSDPRPRARRPAALPIIAIPMGDRDVVRAAFAWNLAVEIARLGAHATLLAPDHPEGASLWPASGRGPIGAELDLVRVANLKELNHAALDVAVSKAAGPTDGGVVLARVPLSWTRQPSDSPALLRWVLLFASPDSHDLREAYGLAKQLVLSAPTTRIGLTIHGARRIGEAEDAFARIAGTAQRHLRHSVVSYGLLVDDLHVYRAIVARRPIGLEHPQSRAARALRDVARLLLDDARKQPVG
jgi:hypothetical protein